MITALSLAAFFILLMAIINFVNINIGTSGYRLKEIGLRKVFGSARKATNYPIYYRSMVADGYCSCYFARIVSTFVTAFFTGT